MADDHVNKAKKLLAEVSNIISDASDIEVAEILGDGVLNGFLNSILDPNHKGDIYGYLLENKNRATLIGLLRFAINQNYSFKGNVGETAVFVSPNYFQWYEKGVMFLQGTKPFEGLFGLYIDREVKFGVSARDAKKGDKLGPDDLIFITVEESRERLDNIQPKTFDSLNNSLEVLESMLEKGENDESEYQSLLESNPWMLGAEYDSIDSHKIFDDRNIPDFTGVRVHDRFRDIIEIKAPFIPLFRKDGNFTSQFNEAWNQTENYIDFAVTDKDYLRRKGLNFENPKGYLLAGYNLTEEERAKIRLKERGNPKIKVLTYDEFLNYARHTIEYLKTVKALEIDREDVS
jgi:hypothetical protein